MEQPWATLCAQMVRTQLLERGVQDCQVLDAMRQVPRHQFVPLDCQNQAYEDHPLPIGMNQTISQPYMVAVMTELLALQPTDHVLEIGTGSGYQTAILAELAKSVISIERLEPLAHRARFILEEQGYSNICIRCGDGSLGAEDQAPFDAIIVTAASPVLPQPLQNQLAMNGRLVCPVGPRGLQEVITCTRLENGFQYKKSIRCIFVPLIGTAGWEEPS